ncbi:MAG TPA: hypothetical protein VJ972_13850 [Anaerolineales bacterium]|nr:hypothetical protein [Anaerolineales bacterium]
MKISNRIQLSVPEISLIASSILARKPCNFLVFGMGNDSLFWKFLNRGGQTLFLEDNPHWYQRISQKHPHLNAHLVQYNTKRSQWKDLLSKPADLGFPLPQEVEEIPWDVILVDAPNGWRNDQPGRMKSIYHASKLIRPGGDVFVHDCNRTIERIYSSTFLGNENLVASIGRLRMFCIG